jgi:3-oxoacyl-[acyl-carrier-protein] synthase-1
VRIAGLGFAVETAHIMSEGPLLGKGLAEAARQALTEAQLGMHDIAWRLSDVTGEAYGFKELSLAMSRLMRQRREEMPVWHAADGIGDTGAAAGLVHMVIAHRAFGRGYAPGPDVMCYGSAVAGGRAAAVVRSSAVS